MPKESKLERILKGDMGLCFPRRGRPSLDRRGMERGYVKLGDSGLLEVSTLDEDARLSSLDASIKHPACMAVVTAAGSYVLLDMRAAGNTLAFGGPRASVKRYRARGVLSEVDPRDMESVRFRAVSLMFTNLERWGGMTAVEHKQEHFETGRLKSWTVHLEAPPDLSQRLASGLHLDIGAYWSIATGAAEQMIRAPLTITCRSESPVPLRRLLKPLRLIQDLISFEHRIFMPATDGRADPHLRREPEARPHFWHSFFMRPGVSLEEIHKASRFPLVGLVQLGGIEAVGRWLNLAVKHPLVYEGAFGRYRRAPESDRARLIEVAMAIERWEKLNRRCVWVRGRPRAQATACRLGVAFEEWTGDAVAWSKKFWDAYNCVKHEKGLKGIPPVWQLEAYADSGELALAALLLNRAANNSKPANSIFDHAWNLGERIRTILAEP